MHIMFFTHQRLVLEHVRPPCSTINIHHPDLVPHPQGKASHYLVLWHLHLTFYTGGHVSVLSELCNKCATGMWNVNGAYYAVQLCDNVQAALCWKQPELLVHGVIFLQKYAVPHHHYDVQSLLKDWGWEVLAYFPYSSDLFPHDYFLFQWRSLFGALDWTFKCHQEGCGTIITPCEHRWLQCFNWSSASKCVDPGGDYTE